MKWYRNRNGQGMTEYLLILAAVVALAVILINQFSPAFNAKMTAMLAQLNSAPTT